MEVQTDVLVHSEQRFKLQINLNEGNCTESNYSDCKPCGAATISALFLYNT